MSSLDSIPSRYSDQRKHIKWVMYDQLSLQFSIYFDAINVDVCFRGEDSACTYSATAVLHLFPVFQVHGPDVAIKKAHWVRNCVRPHTAEIQSIKSHWSLQCHLSEICQSQSKRRLPSPPFALLIRNGNVETFVINVSKRPAGRKPRLVRN